MPAKHLTPDELEAYARRALSPMDALAISDHLLECDGCREQARSAILAAAAAAPASDVTYEELAAWVDNELDPIARREVQLKLANSPVARAELRDLLRFKAEAGTPNSTARSATSPEPSNVVPLFSARWALPLAAALALCAGALWWSYHHSRAGAGGFVHLRDNGRELRLTSASDSGAFRQLPDDLRAAVRSAAVDGEVRVPDSVIALMGRRGTLAGASAAEPVQFRVLSPVGTAVRDGRTQFRWTPLADATAYRIRVVSFNTGELVASETINVSTPSWTPQTALRDGETYEWEVEALNGEQVLAKAPEPPQPEARFAVISAPERAELDRVREQSRGSHLAFGVANVAAGLLDEAASEFTALVAENPGSPVAKRLLDDLQQRRQPK